MNEENIEQITRSTHAVSKWSIQLLTNLGVPENWVTYINLLFLLIILFVLVVTLQSVTRKILHLILRRTAKITGIEFLGYLSVRRFPHYLAMVIPYSVVKGSIPIIFDRLPGMIDVTTKGVNIFLIFYVVWLLISIANAFADTIRTKPSMIDKPIESYLQVVKIILYSIGFIILFSVLTGQKPGVILGGLGAASAILMLIFKDTILGFVASMQVSANDMVRIGDWITMPRFGADGDVIQITLTTVKIRNFDKTITTIPPYSLVSDSFQNWRGMQETGGRRLKRALYIKQPSIRFLSDDELTGLQKIQFIAQYIRTRSSEIDTYNQTAGVDKSLPLNGRNLTNMGLFREYIKNYLSHHPDVHKELMLMVRQLEPTPKGLPLELYFFTTTTEWARYEEISSDIFDHVTAATKYFDLELYEDISNPLVTSVQRIDQAVVDDA